MEIGGIRAAEQAPEASAAASTAAAAAAAAAAKGERQDKAEKRELIRAVNSVNESGILAVNQELTFFVDRETRRMVVRVVDRDTDEVLLQIPNQQVLRMATKLRRG